MDGMVMGVGKKCYVCGKTIVKGSRAFRARSQMTPSGAITYPKFDGGSQIYPTFRHLKCDPT